MTPFEQILLWIERELGVDTSKGGLVDAVLRCVTDRCTALNIGVRAYLPLIETDPLETERIIHAVSVPHTWFMRDREQLDEVIEHIAACAPRDRPADIWVAGCATGEEAYSLAMLARARGIQVRILATDMNKPALAFAARGRYSAWALRSLTPPQRASLQTISDGVFEVSRDLRDMIVFESHNLVDDPLRAIEGWHAIVCRNVLLYFARPRALEVVRRLRVTLARNGRLVLAASDLLAEASVVDNDDRLERSERITVPVPTPVSLLAVPPPEREEPASPAVQTLDRAHAALDGGDVDTACTEFKIAISEDPLSAEAYLFHGIASDIAGNEMTALSSFRSARLLDASLWAADFYLGMAHARRGAVDEAARCFVRMLAAASEPRPASRSKLEARLEDGRTHMIDAARVHLRELQSGTRGRKGRQSV